MFTVILADHYRNHRCIVEKNVPKAFILPSRCQDGAVSLGIKTTSCLWHCIVKTYSHELRSMHASAVEGCSAEN